ncbi:glycosyltransferase [Lachnospiraceae bacterium 62-35]
MSDIVSWSDMISVIVPVYNVENYLYRSIESVLNQTYKNLEIILVDDGSIDESPDICERLKKRDSRIRVIHQKNAGLSAARNVGIDICNGKYVFFLDSDDLLFPTAFETLYSLLKDNKADIAIGGTYTSFSSRYELPQNVSENTIIGKVGSIEAIEESLYSKKFSPSAWGKLYKRGLFDEIRYPVGKYYEDLFTTYKLFLKASTVIYTTQKIYCYFKRAGSISMEKGLSEKQFDCYQALENIKDELLSDYPQLQKAYKNCYLSFFIRLTQNAQKGQLKRLNKVVKNVKKYRLTVFMDKNALKRTRVIALVSFFGIRITKQAIDSWYKRKA